MMKKLLILWISLLLLTGCQLVEIPYGGVTDAREWLNETYGEHTADWLEDALANRTVDFDEVPLYDRLLRALEEDWALRTINNIIAVDGFNAWKAHPEHNKLWKALTIDGMAVYREGLVALIMFSFAELPELSL